MVTVLIAVCHLPSSVSRISITGCLGSPMMTPAGAALTISALKNSEFSSTASSAIVTLKSCRVLPGGKVMSKVLLGI